MSTKSYEATVKATMRPTTNLTSCSEAIDDTPILETEDNESPVSHELRLLTVGLRSLRYRLTNLGNRLDGITGSQAGTSGGELKKMEPGSPLVHNLRGKVDELTSLDQMVEDLLDRLEI